MATSANKLTLIDLSNYFHSHCIIAIGRYKALDGWDEGGVGGWGGWAARVGLYLLLRLFR